MALAQIADVETLLRVTIGVDAALTAQLEVASSIISGWLGWNPEEESGAVATLTAQPGSRMITLPSMYVTDVVSVVENGDTLTEGNEEDYTWESDGRLYRNGVPWFSFRRQGIVVTYDSGYSVMPPAIEGACAAMAASAYILGEAWGAVVAAGAEGLKSERMPDGYQYTVSDVVQQSQGLASGVLPPSLRTQLAPYRIEVMV